MRSWGSFGILGAGVVSGNLGAGMGSSRRGSFCLLPGMWTVYTDEESREFGARLAKFWGCIDGLQAGCLSGYQGAGMTSHGA